jgi:hypothetical protein
VAMGQADGIDAGETDSTADDELDEMEEEVADADDKGVGANSSVVTDARLYWHEAIVTSAGRRD